MVYHIWKDILPSSMITFHTSVHIIMIIQSLYKHEMSAVLIIKLLVSVGTNHLIRVIKVTILTTFIYIFLDEIMNFLLKNNTWKLPYPNYGARSIINLRFEDKLHYLVDKKRNKFVYNLEIIKKIGT